jgi:hypothetical protein
LVLGFDFDEATLTNITIEGMDNHLNGQILERLVVIWILLTKWNYGG